MDLNMAGKTAIVTGGASNVGHGIVMVFAREGANVAIADMDEVQAQRTARMASEYGARVISIKTDVTRFEQCDSMVKKTLDEFGHIDVLVNDAGAGPGSELNFRQTTIEVARKVVDLNYWGAYNCSKAVLDHMMAQKSGNIVHISSVAARRGQSCLSLYSSAKAGIIGLTIAQAWEFAQFGIRINAVCPGRIIPDTPEQVSEARWKKLQEVENSPVIKEVYKSAALQKPGHPSDIANMVIFLASDAARFITGQAINVDGGVVMP